MQTVIVTLRSQADLGSIPGGDHAARQQGIIRALQAHAAKSQRALLRYLDGEQALGHVGGDISFWVFNGLSVTATPAVIAEIAARADVASVTPDEVPIVPASVLAPAIAAADAPASSVPTEPNIATVNGPAMWSLGFTGQGVVVANLDSGVDAGHPDLAARWRGGSNSWFDPYGQHPVTPTDLSGHGTATMGVIVGGDAGGTSIGMAPGATWIAARIFGFSSFAAASSGVPTKK
jgi:subtilisin family serine protease